MTSDAVYRLHCMCFVMWDSLRCFLNMCVPSWVCLQRSYGVINIPAVIAAPLTLRYMTRQLCLYLSTCCTFSLNVSLNFLTTEHPPIQTNTYKHIPNAITKKPKPKYLFLLHVGVSSDSYHSCAVILRGLLQTSHLSHLFICLYWQMQDRYT